MAWMKVLKSVQFFFLFFSVKLLLCIETHVRISMDPIFKSLRGIRYIFWNRKNSRIIIIYCNPHPKHRFRFNFYCFLFNCTRTECLLSSSSFFIFFCVWREQSSAPNPVLLALNLNNNHSSINSNNSVFFVVVVVRSLVRFIVFKPKLMNLTK